MPRRDMSELLRQRSWTGRGSNPRPPGSRRALSPRTISIRPVESSAPPVSGAVLVELAFRVERGAEACECVDERVRLVERVLTLLRRLELEPEADLVRAVCDSQSDLRHRRTVAPATAGRVLDE